MEPLNFSTLERVANISIDSIVSDKNSYCLFADSTGKNPMKKIRKHITIIMVVVNFFGSYFKVH
jgi:hypothetical protein